MPQEKIGNPSGHNLLQKLLASGSISLLTLIAACSPSGDGQPAVPSKAPTAEAPADPTASPTPDTSEGTPANPRTSEATPTVSDSPVGIETPSGIETTETNPFVNERFNELDAMSLEEFESQPREDRVAYMAAFMKKLSAPEWEFVIYENYRQYNPLLGAASKDNTESEIAHQQFFKDIVATSLEPIDADYLDYARQPDPLVGKKLISARYFSNPDQMDSITRSMYETELKTVDAIASKELAGIKANITINNDAAENITLEVEGEEYTARIVIARQSNESGEITTQTTYIYVEDEIAGEIVSQWLPLETRVVPNSVVG